MVILDTNIIIDHLRTSSSKVSKLRQIAEKQGSESLAISVVTIQELFEGESTKDQTKLNHMLATIAPLKVLPYNSEIAELAGKTARDSKMPIEFADTAIAAIAIHFHSELYTLNEKHFADIRGLCLYKES